MRKEGSKTERNHTRISDQIAHNITKHTADTSLRPPQKLMTPRGREISFSEALDSNSAIINSTRRSNRLGGPREHFIQKGAPAPPNPKSKDQTHWPWENDIWSSKNMDWDNGHDQKPFLREKFHNGIVGKQNEQSHSRNSRSHRKVERREGYGSQSLR